MLINYRQIIIEKNQPRPRSPKLKLISTAVNLGCFTVFLFNTCLSASAQITIDQTLPNNSSVMINGNLIQIEGGTKAGRNLFHSFSEFSVNPGTEVYFNNSLDIQNIFTRITGNTISNINGLIQTNGTANLFFLNPNGIIFGPNAALNIGGSFIGSSASSIKFSDGSQFSAKPTNLPSPLLTINTPIGLQFGANPGQIINQSTVSIPNVSQPVGLAVPSDQTLALVGGDILLQGGNLTASGGRIELSAVGDNNSVSLTPLGNGAGFSLGIQDLQNLRDIQLSKGALVNTSGTGGGDIQLQGKQITLQDGASLLGLTLGDLPGGTITVNATGSLAIAGIGDYENIVRKFVTGTIGLTDLHSGLFATTLGTGKAGNVIINTPQFTADNGGYVSATTVSSGQGGTIIVNAGLVQLNSSFIATGTSVNGGNSGDVTVNTNKFIADNNAIITTSSFSTGQGGNLSINAQDSVELIGVNPFTIIPNVQGFTGFFSSGLGAGKAGNLEINTKTLSMLSGSDVAASVFGTGDGGNITIRATNLVELIGKSPNGEALTSINTLTQPGSTGKGGNLVIQTPNLTLQDGATLSVRSRGSGSTGNLQVIANTVKIINQSGIEGTAVAGEGANLDFNTNTLQITQNSFISATAGTEGGPGNGGNININTNTLGLLENSSIVANAFSGKGGNITINTQGNFISADSKITASSTLGVSGVIAINTPEIDPTKGLVNLPQNFTNARSLISSSCDRAQSNQFTITGKGGLPPDPNQTLLGTAVWRDLRSLNLGRVSQTTDQTNQFDVTLRKKFPPRILEANGWIIDQQGKVKLVVDTTQGSIPHIWYFPVECGGISRSS